MKKWIPVFLILSMVVTLLNAQQFTPPQKNFGKYVTNGVGWADYDNDGFLDVYMTNGFQGSSPFLWENFLYHNLGNGTFDSVTTAGTVTSDAFLSAGCSWGDYDNDGDMDVIVGGPLTHQSGSGFFATNYSETKVYKNNNDGTFTDVTNLGDLGIEVSGGSTAFSHLSATWLDFDADGDLDVIESNATFLGGAQNFTMYSNNGDGTFTSISNNITAAQSARAGFTAADFDEDGDIDIVTLAGNTGQNTTLWINTGSNFTETVLLAGGTTYNSQSATWLDYDGDGDLDLYIAIAGDDSSNPQPNHLFKNNSGTLVEVTSGVGPIITNTDLCLVTAAADYDNDGDIDIYTATNGDLTTSPPYHNFLYTNNGSGVFSENTSTGLDTSGYGEGGAFADIDNDGDMDLMLGRQGKNYLYINNGTPNNWMEILCKGDGNAVNSSAIGALVKVTASISGSSKTMIRDVSAQTGRGSHNMLRTHFGVGNATSASNITVRWPGPGTTTSYTDMPVGKIMVYKYAALTGTASVIPQQNFMYLIGSTGASVDFTSNTATSAGTLTITRTNSDPGSAGYSGTATSADASTITPNSVSADRYWTISETGLTGKFTCEVYFDITGLTGITNPDRLVILKRADAASPWTPLNSLRIGNTLYSNASVSSFSQFGIGYNSADQSLPVELVSFKAIRVQNSVKLQWQTASELENVGFILERSTTPDGAFSEIASYRTDDALRGQGNSNQAHSYVYIDNAVDAGRDYFYRLSDIAIDGARTFHSVVKASAPVMITNFVLHAAYPNPFNPSTHIKVDIAQNDSRLVLNVYNTLGERIQTLYNGPISSGVHTFTWNGKNDRDAAQASGVYILRAQSGKQIRTQKMLLVR